MFDFHLLSKPELIAWFAAHPFLRNELLLIFGAVSAMAKKDWEAFQKYKVGEPHAAFNFRVAAWQYFQGVLIGGIPPLVAELWSILGGIPQ